MATAQTPRVRRTFAHGQTAERSASVGRVGRAFWTAFVVVILAGAAVDGALLVASGMPSALIAQVEQLPPSVAIGSGVVLLLVAVPGGRWEARRLWHAHRRRVRERRIAALMPLANLLRVAPPDFGRVSVQTLHALTPSDFERAMAALLAARAYRDVVRSGGPGDLCADLTAVAPGGKHIVVQCKRYAPSHHVGSPELQQFLGMVLVHHKVPLGLYLTTSSYTPAALKLAAAHAGRLQLIDGERLVAMVRDLAVR